MSFTLLPAIDVAGGRAVRLAQGRSDSAVDHGDPFELARSWHALGATWIHLVDLDAAFARGSNAELLARLVETLDLEVQLSGGIVDEASATGALATGCARVNLATSALVDRATVERLVHVHGRRIAVSLDVTAEADGGYRLISRGSRVDVGELWETVDWLDRAGCARYTVTDVGRDGMLAGPNVELLTAVTRRSPAAVVASGGIGSLDDLRVLADGTAVEGAVVGAALSAGRFTLSEALEVVRG